MLSFSCTETASTEADSDRTEKSVINTDDSTIIEENEEVIVNLIFPEAIVDDPCLPYPTDEFLDYLRYDSLSKKYSDEYNVLYNYLVAHFDSLAPKKIFDVEDEYDMGTYHWEQVFSNGIKYEEFFGGEGGPMAIIQTECTDRVAIFSTLNPLVNYSLDIPDYEDPDGSKWNEDSTEFAPNGAGCYYNIMLNDSTETYFIDNYCGC